MMSFGTLVLFVLGLCFVIGINNMRKASKGYGRQPRFFKGNALIAPERASLNQKIDLFVSGFVVVSAILFFIIIIILGYVKF